MLLVSVVALVGCAAQRVWTYKAEPYVGTKPLVNKTVAVIPLSDQRGKIYKDFSMLWIIPLMPFGWQDMQTPEKEAKKGTAHILSSHWSFWPSEDISKAIAEELHNSGIFKEVFFTYKASEGDLILRGEIKSTRYKGKLFSYGLSHFSVLTWPCGLPMGSAKNELGISLQLEDPAREQILWESSYVKTRGTVCWIYYFRSDFFYDSLLKEIMKEVTDSLKLKFAHYQE